MGVFFSSIKYNFLFCSLNRAKYHVLKYGTDIGIEGDGKPPLYEESSTGGGSEGGGGDYEAIFSSVSNISWKQGRQLLRE